MCLTCQKQETENTTKRHDIILIPSFWRLPASRDFPGPALTYSQVATIFNNALLRRKNGAIRPSNMEAEGATICAIDSS